MQYFNADLYRINLSQSPECSCTHHLENVKHYLLECPLYNEARGVLLRNMSKYGIVNTDVLLSGSDLRSMDENSEIFLAVQLYIKQTKRFT